MSAKTIVLVIFLMSFGTWTYADECNGLRYSDNGDGTVQDCRTGLIWLKNAKCTDQSGGIANPDGYLSWYDAIKWVAALASGTCGLTDESYAGEWRLPTVTEWRAMIASAKKQGFNSPVLTNAAGTAKWTNGDIFLNVHPSSYYWSSTTSAPDTAAWLIYTGSGSIGAFLKISESYIWPVRGGQSGEFGSVIIQ